MKTRLQITKAAFVSLEKTHGIFVKKYQKIDREMIERGKNLEKFRRLFLIHFDFLPQLFKEQAWPVLKNCVARNTPKSSNYREYIAENKRIEAAIAAGKDEEDD